MNIMSPISNTSNMSPSKYISFINYNVPTLCTILRELENVEFIIPEQMNEDKGLTNSPNNITVNQDQGFAHPDEVFTTPLKNNTNSIGKKAIDGC